MANYIIQDGQNIFDIATSLYGSPEYAISILKANSGFTSANQITGLTQMNIVYDPQVKKDNQILNVSNNTPSASASTYSTFEAQSLFDLALQVYGNLENVYDIIKVNGFNNINQNVFPQKIKLPYQFVSTSAQTFVNQIFKKNITINTSTPKIRTGSGFSSGFKQTAFH